MTTLPVPHTGLPEWPRPGDFLIEATRASGAITIRCPVPGCMWTSHVGGHKLHLRDLDRRAQQHIDDETPSP